MLHKILVNAQVVIGQNDFKILPLLRTRHDVQPLSDPIIRVRAIHGTDCFSPGVHDSHGLLFSRIVGFENFKEHSHDLASDSLALISFSAKCPLPNATENTIKMFYTMKKNFCCYLSLQFFCGRHVVKIQIKSIMNIYRGWTCRIHYKGNDSHR